MRKVQRAISFALACIMATTLCACKGKKDEKTNIDLASFKMDLFDYSLRDYYPDWDAIQKMIDSTLSDATCQKDIPIDAEFLFNTLKKNSYDKFLKMQDVRPAFVIAEAYPKFLSTLYVGGETVQVVFERALNKAIDIFMANATNDVKEDFHRILKLSFFLGDSSSTLTFDSALYDMDSNIVIINTDILTYGYEGDTIEDSFVRVILRAFNYARELPCSCKEKAALETGKDITYFNGEMNGTSASVNGVVSQSAVDSYIFNVEGVATKPESLNTDEAILFLLGMFGGHSIEDYYNAVFDNDLAKFHAFFQLETEEDITAFYHILYSMDTLVDGTNLVGRLNRNGVPYSYSLIDSAYKLDFYRLSLDRLMAYTVNSDLDLLDNLAILYILRNAATNDVDLYYITNYASFREYFSEIDALTSNFESFLSSYYNVSLDDIKAKEESRDFEHYLQALRGEAPIYLALSSYKAQKLRDKIPVLGYVLKQFPSLAKDTDGNYQNLKVDFTRKRDVWK